MKSSKLVERERAEVGSGNIFADLGLPNPEECLLKSHLVHVLSVEIRKRNLTQQNAASLAGISQPELSRLTHGRFDGFSIDRLFSVVKSFGVNIEITISPSLAQGGQGHLRIREVA